MAKAGKKDRSKEQIQKEKMEHFLRIAPVRVTKAMKAIMLIGNCAGSGYTYTEQQANKIIISLTKAVVAVEQQFKGGGQKTAEFTFNEKT